MCSRRRRDVSCTCLCVCNIGGRVKLSDRRANKSEQMGCTSDLRERIISEVHLDWVSTTQHARLSPPATPIPTVRKLRAISRSSTVYRLHMEIPNAIFDMYPFFEKLLLYDFSKVRTRQRTQPLTPTATLSSSRSAPRRAAKERAHHLGNGYIVHLCWLVKADLVFPKPANKICPSQVQPRPCEAYCCTIARDQHVDTKIVNIISFSQM